MSSIVLVRAGPLTTMQDLGRPGQLAHGVSASGALDRGAYRLAEALTGKTCGAALEFASSGLCFRYLGGNCIAGVAGGAFVLKVNGEARDWPSAFPLSDGDLVDIMTGPWGNYGYIRFDKEFKCAPVMGSRATNAVVGLGGHEGRVLREGDALDLEELVTPDRPMAGRAAARNKESGDPIRVLWSVHADLFPERARSAFISARFQVTARMDRMGVRLRDAEDVFADTDILSLVSDSTIPGDIQILGDGTPIVLLRDHQPTGGYPRIATVITADFDRFVQIRPGKTVRFKPVTIETAQTALKVALQ